MQFQKERKNIPGTPWKVIKNSLGGGGGGVFKVKHSKATLKLHWNSGGTGCKTKKKLWGSILDIFWNCTFVTEVVSYFFLFLPFTSEFTVTCSSNVFFFFFFISESNFWLIWNPRKSIWT